MGGPIKQDSLWFYFTSRYFTNEYYIAAGSIRWIRRPSCAELPAGIRRHVHLRQQRAGDLGDFQQAEDLGLVRISVQGGSALADPGFNVSPEAVRVTTWHTQLSTTKWTYTATNRLLFEAGSRGREPRHHQARPGRRSDGPSRERCASFTRAGAGNFNYRAPTRLGLGRRLPSQSFNASASYVTGSHNAKVGVEMQRATSSAATTTIRRAGLVHRRRRRAQFVTDSVAARRLAEQPELQHGHLRAGSVDDGPPDAQRRRSSRSAERVDEPFTAAPHRGCRTGTIVRRGRERAELEGRQPADRRRLRCVWQRQDRHEGKRQPRRRAGLHPLCAREQSGGDAGHANAACLDRQRKLSPELHLRRGSSRIGDLCGAWQTPSFGSVVPGTRYDPAILDGWGVRPWNWEFSAGVQHEIVPRLSASFGYFRRIQGNFYVMDNEALSPSDFTEFSVFTGQCIAERPPARRRADGRRIYDPNFIVAPQNVIKDASQFGKQKGHWDGYDKPQCPAAQRPVPSGWRRNRKGDE